ncbi:MAG: hypothetical protein ABI748_02655 [Dokdonella sp.]
MMNKLGLVTIACVFGMTACSQLREPADAQLATLLHGEGASPADATALLDNKAIDCMRSWSGNEKLLQNLPVGATSVEGKKACQGKLDGLLADAARNPEKFKFAELTAPKVVTRAIELQEARRMAELANPATHVPPAALTNHEPTPAPFVVPESTVDLGAAGARLKEAETLCQQVQQAAAKEAANASLKGLAPFCASSLRTLRTSMQQAARNGQGSDRLDVIAESADNIAVAARNALAKGSN